MRVMGQDGAYVKGWGGVQPVLVAVDLGTGEPVAPGYANEKDPKAARRFLEPLVQRLGVRVIVTDDLVTSSKWLSSWTWGSRFANFTCAAGWVARCGTWKRPYPKRWQWVITEVKHILDELPAGGEKRLVELWRQLLVSRQGRMREAYAPLDQLRYLLARLMRDYPRYRVFDWQPEVPWTNNATERAIGKMKMRARTVRGYKNWPDMQNRL